MDSLKSLLFTLMVGSLAQGMIAQELYEGDAETYLQKAQTLDRGQNFGSEIREAISLYQQAASLGSADAAYQLAMIYIEGRGTPKNPTRGYSLLKKSALAKNADAAVLWAEVLSAEGNYQEAYIYASIAQIYADSQATFENSIELQNDVGSNLPDLILILLQEKMTVCAENDLVDCGLEGEFQELTDDLGSSVEEQASVTAESLEPDTTIRLEDKPEDKNKKLREIVNFTLDQFDSSYGAEVFYVSDEIFEIGVVSATDEPNQISSHQFTIIVDSGGDPLRVINNFSVGEIKLADKEAVINALNNGKYPTEADRDIKRFQVNVIVGSSSEYEKLDARADSSELFYITRRLAKAIRAENVADADSAYAELIAASYGNFMQLATILTAVVRYKDFKEDSVPSMIDAIDSVLTLNGNLLIPVYGRAYLEREKQIASYPKWAIFASENNAVEINLLTRASVTQLETVKGLRREYFRLFVQNRRFLEAKHIRELQELYEDADYLLATAEVASRIDVVLATKPKRIVKDIIDSDGLASVEFESDELLVELEAGEITGAEIVCESYYEELNLSDTIELPSRPELGECRLYILGSEGTTYNVTYN